MPVRAYHVIFCTHGFWPPNDRCGSYSIEVRSEPLREHGPATKVSTRKSVAGKPHDYQARKAAKQALVLPEVTFNEHQALSVARGFAASVEKSKYKIHACSILPQHVHMVIARHHYDIEQVVRLLKQAATLRLLEDNLHPFAHLRKDGKHLPSAWAQDFWKVFLYTPTEIQQKIEYVWNNPIKEGKRPQKWSFVVPYNGD